MHSNSDCVPTVRDVPRWGRVPGLLPVISLVLGCVVAAPPPAPAGGRDGGPSRSDAQATGAATTVDGAPSDGATPGEPPKTAPTYPQTPPVTSPPPEPAPDGSASFSDAAPDAQIADPQSWREHWFEHVQLLTLIAHDDDVAVYFDDDVTRGTASWIFPHLSKVWRYAKKTYGIPSDERLYVIVHQGKYGGGHVARSFSASHDHRNVIDIGLGTLERGSSIELFTSMVGRWVQAAPMGVLDDPSWNLAGAGFAKIFTYDTYKALDLTDEADAFYRAAIEEKGTTPRADTYWFRDWFHPLWRDYGGAQVFAKYFRLLSLYYPKVPADEGGRRYAPAMNWGEYVHFMSGAAGKSQKTLATKAFGWTTDQEQLRQTAKTTYSAISY
jgi:hypothetical protein